MLCAMDEFNRNDELYINLCFLDFQSALVAFLQGCCTFGFGFLRMSTKQTFGHWSVGASVVLRIKQVAARSPVRPS